MKIIKLSDITAVSEIPSCIIALGIFDGVHIGHVSLLSKVVELSNIQGITPAVWTFNPKPFLGSSPEITPISEKLKIFYDCGIEFAILEEYDNVKDMCPDEFVKKILIDRFDCQTAVCGYNFTFGRNAAGNAQDLKRLMNSNGRDGYVVDKLTLSDGSEVSSTEVRRAVQHGEMEYAAKLLNRAFSHTSIVVPGKKIGKTLGTPTINQMFSDDVLIPRRGVYATLTVTDNGTFVYPSVTNVGVCPTVSGLNDQRVTTCETYIIGYSGNLYGKAVTVKFLKFLRDERKFETTEELRKAIANDEKKSLEYVERFGISGRC